MKIIFGTTSNTKIEDVHRIIEEEALDLEALTMTDIGWDRGEIEENGLTLSENSLIKANAILAFCRDHNITYPIITDDSGLFVDALNGEPGIYTARYADDELAKDPSLPKYQGVYKLLRNMEGIDDRKAAYHCCVTVMGPDGDYYQEYGETKGVIAREIMGDLTKPYLYSVFMAEGTDVAFNRLDEEQKRDTYRRSTLRRILKKGNNLLNK